MIEAHPTSTPMHLPTNSPRLVLLLLHLSMPLSLGLTYAMLSTKSLRFYLIHWNLIGQQSSTFFDILKGTTSYGLSLRATSSSTPFSITSCDADSAFNVNNKKSTLGSAIFLVLNSDFLVFQHWKWVPQLDPEPFIQFNYPMWQSKSRGYRSKSCVSLQNQTYGDWCIRFCPSS